jgi:hypothetical protein
MVIKSSHNLVQRSGMAIDPDLIRFTPIPNYQTARNVEGRSTTLNERNKNLAELTKHITREHSQKKSKLSNPMVNLKTQFITKGLLCKDCKRYMARAHYSVCKRCYQKRVQKLLKNGGVYILTPKIHKQLERELRV